MPLSLSQAARRAGVSKSSIWRAVRAGKLKASKTPGGRFQINEQALDDAFPRKPGLSATATVVRAGIMERLAAQEKQIADLQEQLADMKAQRDHWQRLAERLAAK